MILAATAAHPQEKREHMAKSTLSVLDHIKYIIAVSLRICTSHLKVLYAPGYCCGLISNRMFCVQCVDIRHEPYILDAHNRSTVAGCPKANGCIFPDLEPYLYPGAWLVSTVGMCYRTENDSVTNFTSQKSENCQCDSPLFRLRRLDHTVEMRRRPTRLWIMQRQERRVSA